MSKSQRFKCTLKPGVTISRGQGIVGELKAIYVYGPGPWGSIYSADLATCEACPIDSEPTTIECGARGYV
jgi:hypothetical protein